MHVCVAVFFLTWLMGISLGRSSQYSD